MSEYEMNMSDEKRPNVKKLLPKGERIFEIMSVREQVSKSGNNMIVFGIKDIETSYEEEIYAVSEPKKRWFLKSLLTAVGCVGGEDGVYKWSFNDVLGQKFTGTVEHEPNSYFNRDGDKIETTQHRITEVKPIEIEERGWDEDK